MLASRPIERAPSGAPGKALPTSVQICGFAPPARNQWQFYTSEIAMGTLN
jgi:hypothetical protein